MSVNRKTIDTTIENVWSVLGDGSTYADWVVGAREIRDVDKDWPSVGAKLHHTVKAGPVTSKDDTVVIKCEPIHHLVLRGHARPYGTAEIRFDLSAKGSWTEVTIEEQVVAGPGSLLPKVVQDPLLKTRNVKTLANLERVCKQRQAR